MAKKTRRLRRWTKEDVRTLKTLARNKVKTSVIARRLKRTEGATRQHAFKLGGFFPGGSRKEKRGVIVYLLVHNPERKKQRCQSHEGVQGAGRLELSQRPSLLVAQLRP